MYGRRYDRRFRSWRATFHTSPHRTQRQYDESVTVLLVVTISLERHSGQFVGDGADSDSGLERDSVIEQPHLRSGRIPSNLMRCAPVSGTVKVEASCVPAADGTSVPQEDLRTYGSEDLTTFATAVRTCEPALRSTQAKTSSLRASAIRG
jgi:hypothetical protein